MTRFVWSKNKKGAALVYAVMVLLFLATIVVAMTAIASASYADAVLTASDDQSYYYAKSIGLAIKEQFKDGYNIDKIITKLDAEEEIYQAKVKAKESYDPKVTGTFIVTDEKEEKINGTVQMRYARNSDGSANINIIEVRTACLVNNSLAAVTSVYSCEDDGDEEIEHLEDALTDYNVILTNTADLKFDFAQSSDSSDKSNLSVYVYAGEDDNVTNPIFYLDLNLGGKLTTTGKTTIWSRKYSAATPYNNAITGNLTGYGDLALYATCVNGANGIHAKGNVTLHQYSFVKTNIYAKGSVTLYAPGKACHSYVVKYDGGKGYSGAAIYSNKDGQYPQAQNVLAQDTVKMYNGAFITGDVLSHGDVELNGFSGYYDQAGETCVGGSIYADGNVTIKTGALVLGNIYAKGNVSVETGARVVGNVQSVSGNISVLGGSIGGQVNCPNGTLTLNNSGKDAYCNYFAVSGDARGYAPFGGIGLNQPSYGFYNHTCNKFVTGDCEHMSTVLGNLYVTTETQNNATYLYSLWAKFGRIYLLNSSAAFTNGSRVYVGANGAGNAYTWIEEIDQKIDLIDYVGGAWLNMAGAYVSKLNVGSSGYYLCDAYLYNGWVANINARCLFLCDMRLDYSWLDFNMPVLTAKFSLIYAAQFVHLYGSGAKYTAAGYNRTGTVNGAYPYVDGVMRVPDYVTIEVGCRNVSYYPGQFKTEQRCGFSLGINTEVAQLATVKVGSDWSAEYGGIQSYVMLGDDGAGGDAAKFYGTLHACVGSFKITGRTRLSTKTQASDGGTLSAAKIYAEITGNENLIYANLAIRPTAAAGSFYVEKANGTQYRYGSVVEVKGNCYLDGVLYDFKHFERDDDTTFGNDNNMKINGTLITTCRTVNLQGTSSNFNAVQATNEEAVVTLTGNLTTKGLIVNGTLDIKGSDPDNKVKTLTVNGDCYIGKLKRNDMENTYVQGNLTIMDVADASTPIMASTKLKVDGDLYLKKGSLTLDKKNSGVGKNIKLDNGNLSVSCSGGMIAVGMAEVNGNITLSSGGMLQGNFKCKNFELSGGTVSNSTSTIQAYVNGTFTHSSGTIERVEMTVTSSNGTKAVNITGGSGTKVYIYAKNGGATITGGSGLNYHDGGNISAKYDVKVSGGFECGITSREGSVEIGTDGDGSEYNVGYSVAGATTDAGYCVIYAKKNVTWKGKAKSKFSGLIGTTGSGSWTSTNKTDDSTSSYSFTPTSPCSVAFDWTVSSEENYDWFYILVGSTEVLKVSGSKSGTFSHFVEANTKVTLKYTKDYSAANGADQGSASWTITYATPVRITGELAVTIGSSGNYIKGFFGKIASKNESVTAYVESVMGVYSKKNATVFVSKQLGISYSDTSSGVNVEDGNAYVGGKSGSNAILYGHNSVKKGIFSFESKIRTDARIQCKDVANLDYASTLSGTNKLVTLSLYLTHPALSGDGYYYLNYSFVKSASGTAGDFSIEGNLAFAHPVCVKGELWVNGLFKYKGEGASSYSLTDLVSLGGLYCLNESVNVTSDFKGVIHLPNVTSISINAPIEGLNAPKVTSFSIDYDVTNSLTLASCTSLTVPSGRTITGSLTISPTGKVVNNGTVSKSVSCGSYEGTGTVGEHLILNKNATSKITGSGKVSGNIWTAGSLDINTSGTLGSEGSYIYAAKDISIQNAKFTSGMDYILTTGGDIYMKNCAGFVPKVWNMSGEILFSNDNEGKRAEIAAVLSYGTRIRFGTGTSSNYQTVTGDVEWIGTYNGDGLEFWNSKSTIVKGIVNTYGTGNVNFRDAQIEGPAHLMNVGTVSASSDSVFGGVVWINRGSYIKVTTATLNGTMKKDVVIYGTDSTTEVTLGKVGSASTNYVHAHGGKKLTLNGAITGSVNANGVKEVILNKSVSGAFTIGYGTLTTKETDGTIGGNLRAYDANLYINANVGGNVTHTAHAISSTYPMKVVALGNQKKMITVNGNITVHGRLVDNSQQLGKSRTIKCRGSYYADLQKEFNDDSITGDDAKIAGCVALNFTSEDSGSCIILGARAGAYTVKNTEFNINGHLSIYTFYNESKGKYYQMTFNKEVKCNSLAVNAKIGDNKTSLNEWTGAPERKIGFYGKSDNSDKAKGIDKKCWFENFQSYKYLDVYYTNDTYSGASTSVNLMYFKGKVSVSGRVVACHTKFGNQLLTTGQVALSYCSLFSAGYTDDTSHSNFSSDGNGINVSSDGAFLHTTSGGGNNYFNAVQTFSNVSVFNGVSSILGSSVFKGTVYSGSDGEVSYKGHRSTKLFYFGDSVDLYGGSRIYSNAQTGPYLAAGRTIVWVNKGALIVRGGAYIGDKLYSKGTSLNTHDYSQHPGVFVSDTGSGTVSVNGTSYNRGSVTVVANGSITLDICAYREIRAKNSGAVIVAKCGSSDWQQYAGLYLTKGSLTEESSGWIQVYHDTSDRYGERHYWTGVSDTSAYVPDGSKYLAYFNTQWKTYKKTLGVTHDTQTKTYSQTQAQLTQCYKPLSDPTKISITAPTGTGTDALTNTSGISVTDTFTSTYSGSKSAPDKPEIDADDGGAGGSITSGSGEVKPLQVNNECKADAGAELKEQSFTISTTTVGKAQTDLTFGGEYARTAPDPFYYTGVTYTPSVSSNQPAITPKHPSTRWSANDTEHFDTDFKEVKEGEPGYDAYLRKKSYWNTRFIPYVWRLPFEDSSGSGTPANRVLATNEDGKSIERNGTLMLNQENTEYYVNEDHYAGSSLAGIASSINTWRSANISGGKLWDYIVMNSYPDDLGDKLKYHKRRTKILVFESGELPYSAFFMGDGDYSEDFASWNRSADGKTLIVGKSSEEKKQVAWKLSHDNLSYYDGSFVFYTCSNPADPYGKNTKAKDLHVVLPQGIGFEFVEDAENCMTVVGRGRVFLYLTSGDTMIFRSKATSGVTSNPVGGLSKEDDKGKYHPLLYLIGAGTNIDVTFDRMPLGCLVYMPFGNKSELYGSSGSLKSYNTFKNRAGQSFSSKYYTSATNKTTASVARNMLKLDWSNYGSGGARYINGTIVTDNFTYSAGDKGNKLNFSDNKVVIPDFSDTTIYSYSTTSNKMNGGKKYKISEFLMEGPGYSTKLLKWYYKGIRVSA